MIRLQEKIDFKTMLALAITESEKNTHQKNTMNQENKEKWGKDQEKTTTENKKK